MKFVVQYQGDNREWHAVRLTNGEVAVAPPFGATLEEVKNFIDDLNEYMGYTVFPRH